MNNKIGEPVKYLQIRDQRAIELVNQRAIEENRSAANAGALSLVEFLSPKYNKKLKK